MRAPLARLDDALLALARAPEAWGDALWAAGFAVQSGEDAEAVERRLGDAAHPRLAAPPCSCLRWSAWLQQQDLTAASWRRTLQQLRQPGSELTGCPVRAWLTTLPPAAPAVLPLRCAQRLTCTPRGPALLLPPAQLPALAHIRVEVDGTATLNDSAPLRPGDTFALGGLTLQLRAEPLDVACLSRSGASPELAFHPLTEATTYLPPHQLPLVREGTGYTLQRRDGPQLLSVATADALSWDTALLEPRRLHIERWPQPRPPSPAPLHLGDTLLYLRHALADPDPTPDALLHLLDRATLTALLPEEGALAIDYLAEHLQRLPSPQHHRPPCPCGDWRRCLAGSPELHAQRLRWLRDLLGLPLDPRPPRAARPPHPACPRHAWLIAERWSPSADHLALTLGCAQRLALHTEHPALRALPLDADPDLPLLTLLPGGDALLHLPDDGATTTRLTHGDTLLLHGLAFTFYTHNPPGTLEPLDLPGAAPARIDRPVFILGRHDDCDYALPHTTLSKRHIEILYRDGQLWGADLGSANGFYVNQRRAAPQQPLRDQDLLQLGALSFRLHWR